jgi:hypothetical protein
MNSSSTHWYIYSSDIMPLVTRENVLSKQLHFKVNNIFIVDIIKSFHINLTIGLYIFSYGSILNVKKKYDAIIANYMPLSVLIFEPIRDIFALPSNVISNWEFVDEENKIFDKPIQFLLVHFSIPCKQKYEMDILILKEFVNGITVDNLSKTYSCFSFFKLQKPQGDLKCIFGQLSKQIIKEYSCEPLLLSIKQCTLYTH